MDNDKIAAIKCFKHYRKMFCDDYLKFYPKDSIAYQATLKEKEFFDMAIRALEQEHFYDKIKTRIIKEISTYSGSGEEVIQAYVDGLKKGLKIINEFQSKM